MGVVLTHTKNLIIKKLRIARETGDLEAETGEETKKPDIGRVVESYFNLPNEYSSNIDAHNNALNRPKPPGRKGSSERGSLPDYRE